MLPVTLHIEETSQPVYHLRLPAADGQLVVLLPAAWLLAKLTGNLNSVWFAFIIAEVTSFTLSIIFFRTVYKQVVAPIKEE